MLEECTPYVEAKPSDLIEAEKWNQMQCEIKKDIHNQVGQVQQDLDDFKEAPVNADTFDGKTPQEWVTQLDKRYASQEHSHDTVKQYQRYFLEMETVLATTPPRLQPAVIIHNMKRHPQVQVYELLDLPLEPQEGQDFSREYKFVIAGPPHASDPEAMNFKTKSWDERHWGDPLDIVVEGLMWDLTEEEKKSMQAKFQPGFTLNVWISNLEEALFEPGPAQYHFDMGDVHRTQWVKDRASKKVQELIDSGEWPPRFVYRPRLVNMLDLGPVQFNDDGTPSLGDNRIVEIYHLNTNEVEITPINLSVANDNGPASAPEAHFMILLKV